MKTGEKGVLIRTDGNEEIASGHLMRCLAIAEALREIGAAVVFGVADRKSERLLHSFMEMESDFPVVCLNSDYHNPDSELDRLCAVISENNIGCVLADSYFVTEGYLERLRQVVRTAYIDDIYAFDYPVDLVINYDAAPAADFYGKCGFKLLGLSYTPLRRQFRGLHPAVRAQVGNILISTGGTDPYGVAKSLMEKLLSAHREENICYHILAGPMHSGRAALELLTEGNSGIKLYEQVYDMAALMCSCDLAVSAAGTTLYELCAAGVPSVSFTMADNQLAVARDMERLAKIPYAGDVRSLPAFADGLADAVQSLIYDFDKRYSLAHSMHQLVDGGGSIRIAKALKKLLF